MKYRKALTFSYDDGIEQDRKLVEIFNRYGMKATFNLNTGIQSPESNFEIEGVHINRMKQDGLAELYKGHGDSNTWSYSCSANRNDKR